MGQLKMNLSVVQLFYLLALFWQKSSHALPALYPGSGLLNSGQNWLQSLLSQSLTADPANALLATLQSRQEKEKYLVQTLICHRLTNQKKSGQTGGKTL